MFLVILLSFWDFSFGDPKCRFGDVYTNCDLSLENRFWAWEVLAWEPAASTSAWPCWQLSSFSPPSPFTGSLPPQTLGWWVIMGKKVNGNKMGKSSTAILDRPRIPQLAGRWREGQSLNAEPSFFFSFFLNYSDVWYLAAWTAEYIVLKQFVISGFWRHLYNGRLVCLQVSLGHKFGLIWTANWQRNLCCQRDPVFRC